MRRVLAFIFIISALTVLLFGYYHRRSGNNATNDTLLSEESKFKETLSPVYDENHDWYSSVKGHYHPGSLENNETREMWTEIWWHPNKGKGMIELVPALKALEEDGLYVDIHTNEPWESKYEGYGDSMWYFQIDCSYKVVEPLFLHYYFNPHFVYEGDLDQDGVPDYGILLARYSTCCSYALLTIDKGHWVLMTEPFIVAHNLRSSGKELAQKGDKKGQIKITRSGFNDDGESTCEWAQIVDTVIVAKRIDIHDFL